MKKAIAVQTANQRKGHTGEEHFVVWDPASFGEVVKRSGFVAKSESQMIEDYGSVENYGCHIVHITGHEYELQT